MAEDTRKTTLEYIAKYTVSAERIRRRPRYWLFIVYTWGNDLIVALAGIGLAYPVLTKVAASTASPETAGAPIFSFGLVLAIIWGVLKVSVTYDNGLKRATLMKSCMKEMLSQRSKVDREALILPQPVGKLQEIHDKLMAIYDRHSQEDSWPWPGGFAPGIDELVKTEVETWFNSWHKKYGATTPVPEENLRKE